MGTAQLFEKTKNGELVFLNNAWTYVLSKNEEDLKTLLKMTKESQRQITFWGESSIVIEGNSLNECLNVFLSYVRCGHNYQENSFGLVFKTLIDEKLNGRNPYFDINFQNWPIKIKSITAIPYCIYLNKDWKEGLPICGEIMDNKQPIEADLCPIFLKNGAASDYGNCLPLMYLCGENKIKINEQKINIYGQEFIYKEISYQE